MPLGELFENFNGRMDEGFTIKDDSEEVNWKREIDKLTHYSVSKMAYPLRRENF